MNPTAAEAEQLRLELHDWFVRNEFLDGLVWQTADEHYGKAHEALPFHHYFVVNYAESEFYDVMNSYAAPSTKRADMERLFGEFEEIVRRRGFWFEREDDVSADILGKDKDEANG